MRSKSATHVGAALIARPALLAAALLGGAGCTVERLNGGGGGPRPRPSPYVASLGNLRTGAAPTQGQVELAMFLFGSEPEAPLTLIKPMDVAAATGELLVCDGALQAVMRWTPQSAALEALLLADLKAAPGALATAPSGDRLIGVDGAVLRFSRGGSVVQRYLMPPATPPARVGGIACVGPLVWVTNLAAHRIEVFDAASGAHQRSIGRRGRGPGEFGLPLGIAASPRGEVYVVDMLSARVQVFSPEGQWLRDLGGPGDRVGYFARPRSAAVGPDGVVFVVDAAAQRVQAFGPDGRSLLAFGGPEDGPDALVLPAGIAIWPGELQASRGLPGGFSKAYYVVVSEQIVRPGLRVFAWSGSLEPQPSLVSSGGPRFASSVPNPHWQPDRCTDCHAAIAGRPAAIPAGDVDRLCLSCHDGRRAPDEAHPIGRAAVTASTRAPADWPLVDGRIGCLTCHDIRKHCEAPASPPAENRALVRGFDAADRFGSCTSCHVAQSWRVNPHRTHGPGLASATTGCGFCHTPRRTAEGAWSPGGALRAPAARLCVNCHTMHADPAPRGHLGAVVPQNAESQAPHAVSSIGLPPGGEQVLPLDDGRITCATCHNPHPADASLAGYFSNARWAVRSTAAADEGKALRLDYATLCRYCHPK